MAHLAILLVLSAAVQTTAPSFTAISSDALGRAVGVSGTPVVLSSHGMVYHVDHSPADFRVFELRLGVFKNVEAADEAMSRLMIRIPVPPDEPTSQPASDIGDACMQWSSTIVFRRANAVVSFTSDGARTQVRELARRIDAAIRDNREIAPQGDFAAPLDIANFPTTVQASQAQTQVGPRGESLRYMQIAPTFPGLGPLDGVMFKVSHGDRAAPHLESGALGKGDTKIRTLGTDGKRVERDRTAAEDARFRLMLPTLSGRHKVQLIAGNRDNVIVTRVVEIEVADGP
ncbi:MAG: hypothetical protein HZB38_05140 [Planctomycetes bacterium]|nr:hypothetical protein [Planctomycetota bacterium]